jgi:hypothetical protein
MGTGGLCISPRHQPAEIARVNFITATDDSGLKSIVMRDTQYTTTSLMFDATRRAA